MLRHVKIQLFIFSILFVSLACGLPNINIPDSNSISTAAAETVIAGLTQNSIQNTALPSETPTLTSTFTFTPTTTLTPTQTLTVTPIFTNTSAITLITVSVPTNCRVGPGKVYPRRGALLVGESAQVFGRDPSNEYWYIQNPDNANDYCWVWGEYATLTGPFGFLPIFTPPPTPTATFTPTPAPAFNTEVTDIDFCAGQWWVEVGVKNTGPIAFKSLELEVFDTVTDIEKTLLTNGFSNKDGCSSTTTKDVIGSNDTFMISSALFDYNLENNKLNLFIKLCSELNQKGICVTREIQFKP